MARTLWPESQKLYGHAFEVYCVAASHKGDCAASACKTKQDSYAAVIIWKIAASQAFGDVNLQQSSVPVCTLEGLGHLTVVQLEFSKDDSMLAGVTRDRQMLIFTRTEEFKFELAQ